MNRLLIKNRTSKYIFKGNTKNKWCTSKYDSQGYQKILSQNTESMPTDVKNSFQQPSSLFYYGPFNPLDEYYYFKIKKDEEDEERKRKNERRRYQNRLFLYNKFRYNNQPRSFPLYIISNSKQQTNNYSKSIFHYKFKSSNVKFSK